MGILKNYIPLSAQSGFALVQALTIIPLLVTAVVAVAAVQYVVRKKLEAQSLCVGTVTALQKDLSKTLSGLTKLNLRARQLRIQRAAADRAFHKALMSGNPYAIAATKAIRISVILAQTAHRAQQEKFLLRARVQRLEAHRTLQLRGRRLAASPVQSQSFYHRALAVKPVPTSSLTPDWVPVTNFRGAQKHQFQFQVNLSPTFWNRPILQSTLCSATLGGKEGAWQPQVVAASALSRRPSF